jgi:asparagine synthase (glutamine-hydrolysing)
MCGILGSCVISGDLPSARAIELALQAIRHRGPDDEGFVFVDSGGGGAMSFAGDDTPGTLDLPLLRDSGAPRGADVVLASRRLAIQDRSPSGHQPMASPDGTCWISYNGEVYNFHELRDELEGLGRRFRTGTDTEVVLQAYEEWGLGCLDRFNGMWGFALWDGRDRRLILSRDRYGVKPLYYSWNGARLVFASEIKALLAWPDVSASPDERVLDDYLALGLVDQSDATFFTGIRQLAPGHTLELQLPGGAPRLRRWYSLPEGGSDDTHDLPERFAALLEDAVDHRLISDVPVGTCLSGGLDSSAVVCLVDRLLDRGRHAGSADRQLTFSARYDDPRHDEGAYIDAVVRSTAAEGHVTYPTGEQLAGHLDELVAQHDEPFWSTSIFAQWLVFRSARESGVVVTLDGQGGDEAAGGYTHYYGPALASLARGGHGRAVVREASALSRNPGTSLLPLAARTAISLAPWELRRRAARRVRRPDWLRESNRRIAPQAANRRMPRDPLAAQIYRDIVLGLRPLLRVADRNSMAHSVESRLPFLDFRLLELGYRAPASAKIHDGLTKVMLRKGLGDLLPQTVLDRRDKIGFSTPEDTWFRGPLRAVVEEVLDAASFQARPWFRAADARKVYAAHLAGDNRALELWRIVNTELWARRFLD